MQCLPSSHTCILVAFCCHLASWNCCCMQIDLVIEAGLVQRVPLLLTLQAYWFGLHTSCSKLLLGQLPAWCSPSSYICTHYCCPVSTYYHDLYLVYHRLCTHCLVHLHSTTWLCSNLCSNLAGAIKKSIAWVKLSSTSECWIRNRSLRTQLSFTNLVE